MKAATYIGLSTHETEEGQETKTQLKEIRDYCEAKGLDIAEEYVVPVHEPKDE